METATLVNDRLFAQMDEMQKEDTEDDWVAERAARDKLRNFAVGGAAGAAAPMWGAAPQAITRRGSDRSEGLIASMDAAEKARVKTNLEYSMSQSIAGWQGTVGLNNAKALGPPTSSKGGPPAHGSFGAGGAPVARRPVASMKLGMEKSMQLSTRMWVVGKLHNIDRDLPIIHPKDLRKIWWDVMIMALIIFSAVTVPIDVSYGFTNIPALEQANWGINLLFLFDICINFRTGFFDSNGNLVRDSGKIAKEYCKFWFWIDAAATIPWDLFARAFGIGGGNTAVLGFLKAPRLLRLGKLVRLLDHIKNVGAFKVVLLLAMMIMIAHWLACIWYMLYKYGGGGSLDDWTFDMFQTTSPVLQYLSAYYSCFLMIMGDNLTPLNDKERLFFIIASILGTCFYSAMLGQMALLVANLNIVASRHNQRQDITLDVIRYTGVPEAETKRVTEYFSYITQYAHPTSEGLGFLQELPKALYRKITDELYKTSLGKIGMFAGVEEPFLANVALRMKLVMFTPKEVIFKAGDLGQEMYTIRKGCVAVVGKHNQMVGLLTPGMTFGQFALLTPGAKRTADTVALSHCDLCVLRANDLKELMRDFPRSGQRVQDNVSRELHAMQAAGRGVFEDDDDDDDFGEPLEDELPSLPGSDDEAEARRASGSGAGHRHVRSSVDSVSLVPDHAGGAPGWDGEHSVRTSATGGPGPNSPLALSPPVWGVRGARASASGMASGSSSPAGSFRARGTRASSSGSAPGVRTSSTGSAGARESPVHVVRGSRLRRASQMSNLGQAVGEGHEDAALLAQQRHRSDDLGDVPLALGAALEHFHGLTPRLNASPQSSARLPTSPHSGQGQHGGGGSSAAASAGSSRPLVQRTGSMMRMFGAIGGAAGAATAGPPLQPTGSMLRMFGASGATGAGAAGPPLQPTGSMLRSFPATDAGAAGAAAAAAAGTARPPLQRAASMMRSTRRSSLIMFPPSEGEAAAGAALTHAHLAATAEEADAPMEWFSAAQRRSSILPRGHQVALAPAGGGTGAGGPGTPNASGHLVPETPTVLQLPTSGGGGEKGGGAAAAAVAAARKAAVAEWWGARMGGAPAPRLVVNGAGNKGRGESAMAQERAIHSELRKLHLADSGGRAQDGGISLADADGATMASLREIIALQHAALAADREERSRTHGRVLQLAQLVGMLMDKMLSLEDWLGTTVKTVGRLEAGHGAAKTILGGDEAETMQRISLKVVDDARGLGGPAARSRRTSGGGNGSGGQGTGSSGQVMSSFKKDKDGSSRM
ncbi:hypothetical protein FOA52_011240 [Chlamydomonas sp. UWO 241]|nr:hypothetical protein FOA52_011240 [Chlamydomonas sp. UWO 241]